MLDEERFAGLDCTYTFTPTRVQLGLDWSTVGLPNPDRPIVDAEETPTARRGRKDYSNFASFQARSAQVRARLKEKAS